MKKLISLIAAVIALAGCDGWSSVKTLAAATADFPDGEVRALPGKSYSFIARASDGSVWYVECMNGSDPKVTSKVKLFDSARK